MARRRGNPNWGRVANVPVPAVTTEFEKVIVRLGLTLDQDREIIRNRSIIDWARRNRNRCYIPERFLETWGFDLKEWDF
jgi:hypothetical protein